MAVTQKIENISILPNVNTDPRALMLLFCFCNEYISLEMKEIYKMSILEEIIPIMVLKWYFKVGILHPHCLWILLIWAGFFIRRPWFVTCSNFYHQKETSKENNSINRKGIVKKIENTSILPNFNTEPYLTSKLILEGSYAFVLFLKWMYILANERNLWNEHFGRNYSGFNSQNWE